MLPSQFPEMILYAELFALHGCMYLRIVSLCFLLFHAMLSFASKWPCFFFATLLVFMSPPRPYPRQVQFPFVAHAMDGNFCAIVPILVGDQLSRAHETALAAQARCEGQRCGG